jgi:uncharacterized membrane protein
MWLAHRSGDVRALAAGTLLPGACHAYMQAWFRLGWPAFVAVLAIYALMVARPDL